MTPEGQQLMVQGLLPSERDTRSGEIMRQRGMLEVQAHLRGGLAGLRPHVRHALQHHILPQHRDPVLPPTLQRSG